MLITKRDLVNNLIAMGYGEYRISRILNISIKQVYKHVLLPEKERQSKPRKPKPVRKQNG